MLIIKNITDYRYDLQLGDIIRCCNSKFPYVEGIVDFMLVKTFCDSDRPEGILSTMVVSGYKSGLINTHYPTESNKENTKLDIDWLKKNWDKWGYIDVELKDVYIIPRNTQCFENIEDKYTRLDKYQDNLERGQIINIPQRKIKFMIVAALWHLQDEFYSMPISGLDTGLISNKQIYKENEPYFLNIDFLKESLDIWIPNNINNELSTKDIFIYPNSSQYPKDLYDLSLEYI